MILWQIAAVVSTKKPDSPAYEQGEKGRDDIGEKVDYYRLTRLQNAAMSGGFALDSNGKY